MRALAGWPFLYYKHLQRDKKFHYNPGRQHPEHQVKTFISLEKFYIPLGNSPFSHQPQKCRSQAPRKTSFFSNAAGPGAARVAAFVRAARAD
jgi:hypothetical protein